MKEAVVTGAHGYIGSVLTKLLKENGWYVIGIDNCRKVVNNRIKYCDEFLNTDFSSTPAIYEITSRPEATVFHLAANSLLGASATEPLKYFNNNTSSTLKMINYLSSTHRFIFASTAAVYAPEHHAVKETDMIAPPNNYGLSKLMTEQMLNSICPVYNIKAISFRFFNVIGSYFDMGQLPDTPHIINQLCKSALTNTPFVINGDEFSTKDGTCVRDYVHVIDICRALIHADEHLRKTNEYKHEAYNLGNCYGTSVKEIVDTFEKVWGIPLDVTVGPRRVGDPPYLVANPEKFINDTGFEYKYSENDIQEMIASAFNYARKVY